MSNVKLTIRAHYTIDGLEPSLDVAATFDPLDSGSVMSSQIELLGKVQEGMKVWAKEVEAWAIDKLESGEWEE